MLYAIAIGALSFSAPPSVVSRRDMLLKAAGIAPVVVAAPVFAEGLLTDQLGSLFEAGDGRPGKAITSAVTDTTAPTLNALADLSKRQEDIATAGKLAAEAKKEASALAKEERLDRIAAEKEARLAAKAAARGQ